ncbi:phasin-related domain-containing protein [Algicola sagamiensis]|uniref:phasin-related domain-containing protein n=1 Tax=Algicola sagamiensis TaxID=163869 RepID=UPI000377B2CC|nr:phasin family protein [Algicola sagamiensis]
MSTMNLLKEKVDLAEGLARKIWLAGLGAYGKGIDEVQDRYEKVNQEASHFFDELVEKGERLEQETKDRLKEKTALETRVSEVRQKLGLDSTDTEKRIEELSLKIDALAEAVSKLSK